jgi:hypothetical protein
VELDIDLALGKLVLRRRVVLRIVGAGVPDHHDSGAVLTFGYHAFEVGIGQRMVLGAYRQTFVRGIHRWASGYRPRYQNPIDRQAEIIVQAAGSVLLNHKDALVVGPPCPPRRLRRAGEVSLPAILVE